MPILTGLALMVACATPQDVPDAARAHPDTRTAASPLDADQPLSAFAAMTTGAWRMGVEDAVQFDTWRWGPGRHSVHKHTHGTAGDGGPWIERQVFYWHPGAEEVRSLTLLPHGWGVGEGVVTAQGDVVTGPYALFQRGRVRDLALRWDFDGPDAYRLTLIEDGRAAVGEWRYARGDERTPPAPVSASPPAWLEAPGLEALAALVGPTWTATLAAPGIDPLALEAQAAWIPFTDALELSATARDASGRALHELEVYVFWNSVSASIEVRALWDSGAVDAGVLTPRGDGTLDVTWTRDEAGGSRRMSAHVAIAHTADSAQLRVWTDENTEGPPALAARLSTDAPSARRIAAPRGAAPDR